MLMNASARSRLALAQPSVRNRSVAADEKLNGILTLKEFWSLEVFKGHGSFFVVHTQHPVEEAEIVIGSLLQRGSPVWSNSSLSRWLYFWGKVTFLEDDPGGYWTGIVKIDRRLVIPRPRNDHGVWPATGMDSSTCILT